MPAQSSSITETLIVNTSGAPLFIGLRRAPTQRWRRSLELAAGAHRRLPGDVRDGLADRIRQSFEEQITAGKLACFVYTRQLVSLPGHTNSAFAAGDIVYLDGNEAKLASSFPWTSNLATTRTNFAGAVLGICVTAKPAGIAGDIQVDTSPTTVHVVSCPSATHEIGDRLAPVKHASADSLLNNQIEGVSSGSQSCFRCVRRDPTEQTTVLVTMQSAHQGIQGPPGPQGPQGPQGEPG